MHNYTLNVQEDLLIRQMTVPSLTQSATGMTVPANSADSGWNPGHLAPYAGASATNGAEWLNQTKFDPFNSGNEI